MRDAIIGPDHHAARFVMELRDACIGLGDTVRQELQRDWLGEGQVVGTIDLAHPSAPQERHEPVTTRHDRAWRKP